MAKIPRLMTAPQFAAWIGKSHRWVLTALKEDRIPEAQKLPIGWVIPANAKVVVKYTDIALPQEMVLDIERRPEPEYKDFSARGNPNPTGAKRIELPGYAAIVKKRGLSQRNVQKRTGVHPHTQRQAIAGKPVNVHSAWKLAKGLGLTIEDLLRKPK